MTGGLQRIECRVYFEDTDAGGVVYYANYLKFYERGRTEYLRTLGYEQDELLLNNIVFVVRHINVDFKQAARFNDLLVVETRIQVVKKASLVFDQQIVTSANADDPSGSNRLLNQAQVKVACVSANSFKPTPIPTEIFRTLNNHE